MIKRQVKNFLLVAGAIAFVVLVVLQFYESDSTATRAVISPEGSSPTERLESIAQIVNTNSDMGEMAHATFMGYNSDEKEWRFSVLILRTPSEIFGTGGAPQGANPLLITYRDVIETIFVQASAVIPEKDGRLSLGVVFPDLRGSLESTDSIGLIDNDPENWNKYLNRTDQAMFMSQEKFAELLQEGSANMEDENTQ